MRTWVVPADLPTIGIFSIGPPRLSVDVMSTITMITGGNKGIGHETARRLQRADHTVVIGARNRELGRAAAADLGVTFVQLDVTDQGSVDAAARQVRADHGRLDVLINNAGITGAFVPLEQGSADDARDVFDTNVFGVIRVTNAFVPLLKVSNHPRIVNISSGVGSIQDTIEHDYFDWQVVPPIYASSKTALNMLTVKYARALPMMRVNAADPGYTRTDLNAGKGAHDVTQGTDEIVRLATIADDGPTGTVGNKQGLLRW
ncbi:short-chain dehydrogenase [Rhodococcus sp. 14-2483-1-1]|nr:short-chain dehydrogenase [Rhodococcus sp. 14-2483-1-1]